MSKIPRQLLVLILFILSSLGVAMPVTAGTRVVGWGTPGAGALAVPATLTNAVAISCGAFWGLALTDQDRLVAWGTVPGPDRGFGSIPMPTELRGICGIAASYGDGAAVLDNGSAVGWTSDTMYNQSGFPSTLRNVVQTYSVGNLTLLVLGDGRVFEIGQQTGGRLYEFPEPHDIVEVSGTTVQVLGRRRDGTVLIWNHFFPLSDQIPSTNTPSQATNVVGVASGLNHHLVLRSDGTVVAWGDNSFSQCNVPETVVGAVAIAAGQNHSVALLADSSVVCWGDSHDRQTNVPVGLRGVVSISARADVTLALVDDEVKEGLPLLVGPPAAVLTPGHPFESRLRIFNSPDTLAVEGLPAGLYFDPRRQSIVGVSSVVGHFPIRLRAKSPAGSTVRQMVLHAVETPPPVLPPPLIVNSVVQHFTVGIETIWTLVARNHPTSWAAENLPAGLMLDSASGIIRGKPLQLGDYSVRLRAMNAAGTNELMVTARVTTLALWPAANLEASENQIPADLGIPVQGAVGNDGHVLVVLSNGVVRAWGANAEGQVDVPGWLLGVKQVAAGTAHSLALRDDGSIVGWGRNTNNEATGAPVGNWVQMASASIYSFAVSSEGQVTAWGDLGAGQNLWPVSFPRPVRMISLGNPHALALLDNGTVIGWGTNDFGQTSVPVELRDVVQVAAGSKFSLALRSDGHVVAWGRGDGGQTAVPANVDNVVMIAAGVDYGLALREDGSVVLWGQKIPEDMRTDELRRVRWIAAGGQSMRMAAVRAPGDDSVIVLRPPQSVTVDSLRSQTVQLSVGAVGVRPLRFQWQFAGTDLPGETNRWLNIERVAGCHLGTYRVRISDGSSETVAAAELRSAGPVGLSSDLELDGFFKLGTYVSVAVHGSQALQISDDLVHWENWYPIFAWGGPVQRFLDPADPDHNRRYFRVLQFHVEPPDGIEPRR